MSTRKTCPECGQEPVRATGNAEAGITLFTCPDGHKWTETTWGTP